MNRHKSLLGFYSHLGISSLDKRGEQVETLWNILECINYRYKFDLNLANRAFLDITWELPIFRRFELVPVTDMGLMIAVVRGHIIVTKVKEYSVAGEDHKVRLKVEPNYYHIFTITAQLIFQILIFTLSYVDLRLKLEILYQISMARQLME